MRVEDIRQDKNKNDYDGNKKKDKNKDTGYHLPATSHLYFSSSFLTAMSYFSAKRGLNLAKSTHSFDP